MIYETSYDDNRTLFRTYKGGRGFFGGVFFFLVGDVKFILRKLLTKKFCFP